MNQATFIENLKKALAKLPASEIQEIISDQEEYIRDAIHAGRTEEEVIKSLGDPKAFAANLVATSRIEFASTPSSLNQQLKSTFSAVLALLALAPFNLIFVLGPFIFFVSMIVAGWVTTGTITASMVLLIFVFIGKFLWMGAGIWAHVSLFCLLLGGLGLTVISMILMYKVSQLFLIATVRYLKWNLSFLRRSA